MVFDDVTDLVQAQRDAAWGEVARRLAHEIKNPLTPIQLSAERLAVKLAPKLDAADQETLKRGAQTIIAQVAAMKHMVDDFAVYARQPRPGTMQPVDLGALLQDVLALYDNLRPHVSLSLPSAPAVIQGEPTRLRQVLHNLLQNAIDAQIDVERPRYDIALDGHGDEVTLVFRRRGRRLQRRSAAPRLRAVRDHQGEGHGARTCDRAQDRRRAPRPRHARQPGAARRARRDRFSRAAGRTA